jgi:hypothetical protein
VDLIYDNRPQVGEQALVVDPVGGEHELEGLGRRDK